MAERIPQDFFQTGFRRPFPENAPMFLKNGKILVKVANATYMLTNFGVIQEAKFQERTLKAAL